MIFLNKENKDKKIVELLNNNFAKTNIEELSYILGNKFEILKRNLIAGIARGIGVGIGVTVITAILIGLLQKIVKLNIPIIGDYIGDIVDIIQKSR